MTQPAMPPTRRPTRLRAPALDHLGLALVAEDSEGSGGELETGSAGRLHLQPARGQHPKECPWANASAVAVGLAQPRDTRSSAGPDLLRALAVRAPSRHRFQSGLPGPDLRRGHTLVLAVIPFAQFVARARHAGEPGQLARFTRTQQRTARTRAKWWPARRARPRRVLAPRSVSGRSVFRCGDRSALQSVSPWRTMKMRSATATRSAPTKGASTLAPVRSISSIFARRRTCRSSLVTSARRNASTISAATSTPITRPPSRGR